MQKLNPQWNKCPRCPKHCKAIILDENWEYDNTNHIKRFLGAEFICRGCHWLKTPSLRIKAWRQMPEGQVMLPGKIPHIISCLGWTEEKLRKLREMDLKQEAKEIQTMKETAEKIRDKKAIALPWSIDLSKLAQHGYSGKEIKIYEQQMMLNAFDKILPINLGNNPDLKKSSQFIDEINRLMEPYDLEIKEIAIKRVM